MRSVWAWDGRRKIVKVEVRPAIWPGLGVKLHCRETVSHKFVRKRKALNPQEVL